MAMTRKKKPRRGRPPGPPENVRSRIFLIRLTEVELGMFTAMAVAAGESTADWARRSLLAACRVTKNRKDDDGR